MMKPPKIQVIIPVYNAEKYLKRCLESLISQTFTEWEAILINDASKDQSALIIEKYVQRDPRFQLTNLEKNCGVSNVRNTALDKLTAEYTAFLDADDYWECEMLQTLLSKAEEHCLDVVQCRYMYDYPGGRQVLPKGAFNQDQLLEGRSLRKVYIRMMTSINMNHVCMKLIRTELLKEIRFDSSLRTAEDLKFCVQLFRLVKKYMFINKAMYHYCRNEESLTGKGLGAMVKLQANRRVALDMVKALPDWGMNRFYFKALCILRPYIIIGSKIIRMLMEKLFTKE